MIKNKKPYLFQVSAKTPWAAGLSGCSFSEQLSWGIFCMNLKTTTTTIIQEK